MIRGFRPASWFLPLLGVACTPGSSPSPTPTPTPVDTVIVVDTVAAHAEDLAQLRDENARLAMQVLERDARIVELELRLNDAMDEAVRSMARVQTATSRAEAASSLAEAEIALEQLRASAGSQTSLELSRAAELIGHSTEAFAAGNYGGAAYLADQARAEAQTGAARFAAGGGADEELLLRPVPLRTTTRSNVRAGPGINYQVQFTIEAGADVTGHASRGRWIRVTDTTGRVGWIFRSLVTGRRP